MRLKGRYCLSCVSVDFSNLVRVERIPSEYPNNRNPLIRKMVHFENGQFVQFHVYCVHVSTLSLIPIKLPDQFEALETEFY